MISFCEAKGEETVRRRTWLASIALGACLAVAGCERETVVIERDQSDIEDAADEVEDAADAVGDAGAEVGDAVRDIEESVEDDRDRN